jgi:hypothetical protein
MVKSKSSRSMPEYSLKPSLMPRSAYCPSGAAPDRIERLPSRQYGAVFELLPDGVQRPGLEVVDDRPLARHRGWRPGVGRRLVLPGRGLDRLHLLRPLHRRVPRCVVGAVDDTVAVSVLDVVPRADDPRTAGHPDGSRDSPGAQQPPRRRFLVHYSRL